MHAAFVMGFGKGAGLFSKAPALPKKRKGPAAAAPPQPEQDQQQNGDFSKKLKKLTPILDDIPMMLRKIQSEAAEIHV